MDVCSGAISPLGSSDKLTIKGAVRDPNKSVAGGGRGQLPGDRNGFPSSRV